MPKKAWPIWWLTIAILVGYPTFSFVYYSALAKTGLLPPDGDSIGIPIFGNLLAAIVLSPFMSSIVGFCLRRYNPQTQLLVWRQDRPIRSCIGTAFFGSGAVFFLWVSFSFARFSRFWFDYLWAGYFLFWTLLLLWLRAALVDQLEVEDPKPNCRKALGRFWNA